MRHLILAIRRTTRRQRRPTRAARTDRTGVAMVLVLVALSSATILTGSYVTSRETAPAIGLNAEAVTASRWSGESTAAISKALLEMPTDWTSSGSALLTDDIPLTGAAGASLITKLDGSPLAGGEEVVLLTTVGSAKGLNTLDQRVIRLRPTRNVATAFDPRLPEFAVYATSRLRIQSGSAILPWWHSPVTSAPPTADIAVSVNSASRLTVDANAVVHSSRLFVDSRGPAALRARPDSLPFCGGAALNAPLPQVGVRPPDALQSLSAQSPYTVLIPIALFSRTLSPGRYSSVSVMNGATVTLGAGDYCVEEDFSLNSSSVLRITGAVRLLVRGDFTLSNRSRIELANNAASLELYVLDDVLIDQSYVGVPSGVSGAGSPTVLLIDEYLDPRRVQLNLPTPPHGGAGSQEITIERSAIAAMLLHAPNATVTINASGIVGRVTGGDLTISGSIVLYDTTLNSGVGLSQPKGPLWTDDGSALRAPIAEAFQSLAANAHVDDVKAAVLSTFGKYGIPLEPSTYGGVSSGAADAESAREASQLLMLENANLLATTFEQGGATGANDEVLGVKPIGGAAAAGLIRAEMQKNNAKTKSGGVGGGAMESGG